MRALFLRGLTREKGHWNGLPEAYSKETGIPTFSIDLPGAGEFFTMNSPFFLDDYVEFLREKIKERSADQTPLLLIGISMGGMIALRWSILYPKEVHAVCTINTSAKNLSKSNERFNLKEWKKLLSILLSQTAEKKEALILDLTTNLISLEEKRSIQKKFTLIQKEHPVSKRSSLAQLYAAQQFSIDEIPLVPVKVIYSKGDKLVQGECSEKLAQFLKASLAVHPHAGHDLPLDDPHWLLSELAKIP